MPTSPTTSNPSTKRIYPAAGLTLSLVHSIPIMLIIPTNTTTTPITLAHHHRVKRQLLQQPNNLLIIPNIVPRKTEVLLMFLESVDVPMEVTRLDPLGLVVQILEDGFLRDRVQRSVRVEKLKFFGDLGVRPPGCCIRVLLLCWRYQPATYSVHGRCPY